MSEKAQRLRQEDFIRHKLYSGERSIVRRYADLVVGGGSLWALLKYELITTLFGHVPGAAGLALRKVFFPLLFARTGHGVVFGRGITIRNPRGIVLGNRVLIDDYCLLDARCAEPVGIEIGEETLIHRGTSMQTGAGPIRVGAHSDIGAGSLVASRGAAVHIGDMVSIGGGCKIGGASLRLGSDKSPAPSDVDDPNDFATRGQERVTRGPVHIHDRCALTMNVLVLEGVTIGAGTIVGAGAVIREDVPADSVVMPHHKLVVIPREQFREGVDVEAPPAPAAAARAYGASHVGPTSGASPLHGLNGSHSIAQSVFKAVAILNDQLPSQSRIENDLRAALIEPAGPLDSLGLINLVVALEDTLAEDHGVRVNLASKVSMVGELSPFATVGSLVTHVHSLVEQSS